MKKADGYLAVRIALALCAVLACILWATAQYAGGVGRQISGPEDLRLELRRAQMLAPPSDSPFAFDAGRFSYVPGGRPFESEFVEGLVSRLDPDGQQTWPVTVYEDRSSRDTVILNGEGAEVGRLAPCASDQIMSQVS